MRRSLYLIPVVAALIVITQFADGTLAERRARASAYDRAVTAEASGDLITAIDAFTDASGYRDAIARKAAVATRLIPYRDAYIAGATALDSGDNAGAVTALLPVVRDLPNYEDASLLLERARIGRMDELHQTVQTATDTSDWFLAEQSLNELAALNPADRDAVDDLTVFRREHGPLVFAREGGLFIVGPDGQDERLVVDGYGAVLPSWSPDRSQIAFVSADGPMRGDQGALYVVRGDSTGLTLLATDARTDVAPIWSPDGRRIAFAAGSDQVGNAFTSSRSIRYVDLVTKNVVDITKGRISNPVSPTWSPSGDRIAFISRWTSDEWVVDHAFPAGMIYVASLAGGEVSPLLPNQMLGARRVSWSPTSDHLLIFSRATGSTLGNETITLVDLQSGQRPFVFSTSFDASTPVWSPDGGRFAFIVDGRVLRIETSTVDRARSTSAQVAVGRSPGHRVRTQSSSSATGTVRPQPSSH